MPDLSTLQTLYDYEWILNVSGQKQFNILDFINMSNLNRFDASNIFICNI